MSTAVQAMLSGMPEPGDLRRVDVNGQTVVMVGSRVVSCFASDDLGMRNIAVVTLTDLGFAGTRVARVMGLTQVYVSMLRTRARREGSAGLVRVRGRRPKLSEHQVRQARGWRAQGVSDVEIGRRLGVSDKTAARVLTGVDVMGEVDAAAAELDLTPDAGPEMESDVEAETNVGKDAEPVAQAVPDVEVVAASDVEVVVEPEAGVLGRLGDVVVASRYAGAMLLHAFFDRVGAGRVLAGVVGRAWRRFDDLAVLVSTALGFAVGSGSLEGTKHLIRSQVGPLAGIAVLPQLRTLRPRLAALAEAADPLTLQRDLAAAMIGVQAPVMDLFFVDDHFVSYGGDKPVGMGHNAKRGRAEKGLGDTLVTDYRGRVVAFLSGEPSGLSVTLPKALTELTQLAPRATRSATSPKVMVGFDRGGSYPKVFTACRSADVDWLTYRCGELAQVAATPRRYFYAGVDGVRAAVVLADELITLKDYGVCRQITLFEGPPGVEKPVLQVLTSDLSAPAAALLAWLRCRWRIENVIKDLLKHYGLDWLCSYTADLVDDTRKVDNPARKKVRAERDQAKHTLAEAERALAQLLRSDLSVAATNKQIPAAQNRITQAHANLDTAEANLKPIPAKLAANQINQGAQRAILRTQRRSLQMVLRLLACNAELWLADRLNTYLRDNDEYRTAARDLLHLDGTITYAPHKITVTLRPPQTRKLALCLTHLITEINTTPPRMPGDPRPITYQLAR